MNSHLLIWWVSAVFSVLATFVSCIKILIRREIRKKAEEFRDTERGLREQSVRNAKLMMKKFRGKFRFRVQPRF